MHFGQNCDTLFSWPDPFGDRYHTLRGVIKKNPLKIKKCIVKDYPLLSKMNNCTPFYKYNVSAAPINTNTHHCLALNSWSTASLISSFLWAMLLLLYAYAGGVSFKKRHTSQLYYDDLLLSNMCYYCYKHCYKAILTRSVSYFGRVGHMCACTHQAHTLLMLSVNFGQNCTLPKFFFFLPELRSGVHRGDPYGVPLCTYEHPKGVLIPTPKGLVSGSFLFW